MIGQVLNIPINSVTGNELTIDKFTDAQVVLQGDHHYIHKGLAFQYACTFSLGNAATKTCVIKTPSNGKYIHWRPTRVSTVTSAIKVELYEKPTYTGGTVLTAQNVNRNSTLLASTVLLDGTISVSNNGTLLSIDALGAGGNPSKVAGGAAGNENEIVLKHDEEYLLIFTNLTSTTTVVTADVFWYEEGEG